MCTNFDYELGSQKQNPSGKRPRLFQASSKRTFEIQEVAIKPALTSKLR
jgi:hypothetical protein